MIYFTSDTHFNHENVIQHSQRPFANLADMTAKLIDNWNAGVKPGDTVYHLGDFALSWGPRNKPLISLLLDQLHGQKWLIKGNHDRKEVTSCKQWVQVLDYHELKVDLGGKHRQRIVLSHYAMRTWNQSHRGAFMLFGHSHGSLTDIGGKTMDVGVDANNYQPVSLDEVVQYMAGREHISNDHHRPDVVAAPVSEPAKYWYDPKRECVCRYAGNYGGDSEQLVLLVESPLESPP